VFVGKLTKDVEPPLTADGDINNQSLIYNTFLATPLLLFGKPGYKEDKWSGTNQTGDNEITISRVIAAFAHHCVVDSNKTWVLVDLQGHMSPEGAITLIDPQAHTCVFLSFNIYTMTNK
jgi:myosin-heavy-chain kinase